MNRIACALALVSTLAVLCTACDSQDHRTPGQKLDSAIATTEKKLERVKDEARAAGRDLLVSASNLDDRIGSTASDAATTARVKAKLAADSELNALKIDVDTSAGRVALTGIAPNAMAREHAASLAKAVEGVRGVDNRLEVAKTSTTTR